MLKYLLTLLCLLIASPAWAAPVVWDASATPVKGATASSCSGTHTATGANRLGVARVFYSGGAPTFTATYDSVAMTLRLQADNSLAGANEYAALLYIPAPGTGAAVTWTIDFSATAARYICFFDTYTNAHQSDFTGGTNAAGDLTSSPITFDVTSATDELVLDIAGYGDGDGQTTGVTALAAGAGQTSRGNEIVATDFGNAIVTDEAGAATVTMSETFGGEQGAQFWVHVAAAFKPAAAAAPSRRPSAPMILP